MRIESALFSSKEGLHVHGQALGVVSDNISNANTVGFKKSRIEFSDLMAEGGEGRRSTAEPAAGNGVQVSTVRAIHEGGAIEFTGRALDVAVDGNGFFLVGDPSAPAYTRAGNFSIDENGILVNGEGLPVLGYTGTGTTLGPVDMENINLAGAATTEASVFANLFSSDELAPEVPQNPASFQAIGQAANFVSSLTVYDSLGVGHDLTVAFYKTDTNTWTVQAYANGDEVGGEQGTPVAIGPDVVLNFSPDGTIAEADQAAAQLTASPPWSGGAAAGEFAIDFSQMTQYGGPSVVRALEQNGEGAGNISEFEFGPDGSIFAVLESGTRALVGALPLATFQNQDGLERAGNGLFLETLSSGSADVGVAGTGNLGKVQGAALERSTVDIANEFVDLVVYQRGYQANSQILNSVSTVIRDTLNLLR